MYTQIKLSDIVETVQYGYTAEKTQEFGKYKYLRITDIVPYFVDKQSVPFALISDEEAKKYLVNSGDVLIARTGATTGFNLVIDDKFENYIFASYLIRFKLNRRKVFPLFLKYVLKSDYWYSFVSQYVSGSAQPGMNPRAFCKFKFKLPDMATQMRIADILSKYDLLVENNKRRIQVLENDAEELYKEWFVRFRYPNYKGDKFIDKQISGWIIGNKKIISIPSNWKIGPFLEIGRFIRGKNITADRMIPGNVPVISAGLQPSGYHETANVHGDSVTISSSGANAGYLSLHMEDIWAADCSYCQNKHLWFIYETLKFLQPVISNMQCGAAQPHVHPKNIHKLNVIIPDEETVSQYENLVKPLFDEIKTLGEQVKSLVMQRDLLLPRLISGRLEVK